MRQLQFVGLTDDRLGLLFRDEGDVSGQPYRLTVDPAFLEALEQLRPSAPGRDREAGAGRSGPSRPAAPASSSAQSKGSGGGAASRPILRGGRTLSGTLSPREIQARLRAGRSVSEVARESGADDEWVERFAPPIRAEQDAAVRRAVELTLSGGRRGASAAPLRESVRRNLLDKGIRLVDGDMASAWSAFQHDGSQWVVRFTYRYRGRDVQADWLVDLRSGSLNALSRSSAALGHVGPRSADAAAGVIDLREAVPGSVPPDRGVVAADLPDDEMTADGAGLSSEPPGPLRQPDAERPPLF